MPRWMDRPVLLFLSTMLFLGIGAACADNRLRYCPRDKITEMLPDLRRCNLTNYVLAEMNLRSVDLRNAWLGGAILDGTDLSGADLRDARLEGARFLGANLQ
jgi:hypothetical protein